VDIYSADVKGKIDFGRKRMSGRYERTATGGEVGRRCLLAGTVPENRTCVKTKKSFLGCVRAQEIFLQVARRAGQS